MVSARQKRTGRARMVTRRQRSALVRIDGVENDSSCGGISWLKRAERRWSAELIGGAQLAA
jgi:hypothetical protein